MKNSLIYICSLFILMITLTTFNLSAAQNEKHCPEGQVYDSELGACIAEDSENGNGEEDNGMMHDDDE